MVIVDTNIVAYLLIQGNRTAEAQALFARDPEWRSEAFLLIEFSNLLATYVRAGSLRRNEAHALLGEVEKRVRGLVNLPHVRALQVAEQFGVSAYDARFLGAAQILGGKLVTEDLQLRAAAPALTQFLADALGR